jgi:hypothetical protein
VRHSGDSLRPPIGLWLVVALLVAARPHPIAAHDIPADVTVQVYVKPAGPSVRVLVRAPLESMRDVIMPTRGPGFLELPRAHDAARVAAELWIANGVRVFEDGRNLGRPAMTAVQVSLPADRSFESWDAALAHVQGAPLPDATDVVATQAWLDVLLEWPIHADTSAFALETDLARLGLRTRSVVRFLPPGGAVRAFTYTGDAGLLHLDPRWHQAAGRFVVSGLRHILGGIDHLLFLVCLVVPVRRLKPLVLLATAFTVAHSITLVAAALDMAPSGAWFPPLIETLIALSIVWLALENIVGASGGRRRWVLTFLFGLVHGFGFSFALRETLQFGGTHLVTSLLAFNAGVELGQIAALLVIVPALRLLFRFAVAERIGGIVISVLVAHQAWHWMLDRGQELLAHDFPFTRSELISGALRASILLWLAGWAYWWAKRKMGKWGNGEMGK